MVQRNRVLDAQGIRNNQQVMAIILASSPDEANADNKMYDKVQMAKDDASKLVDSKSDFMDVSCKL